MAKNQIDMINGNHARNIIRFAIPMMLSDLMWIFFNIADTVIVGKFAGEMALAAVGAVGSLIFFMTALFSGLSTGVNVIIANAIGAKDENGIKKAIHTAVALSILAGLLLTLIGEFLGKYLLIWMHTPQSIINQSILYLKIYFIGATGQLIYDFGAAILRSNGDTKRPFYFLTASSIINMSLNLLLVIVFKMSVAGVAIATAISQIFCGMMILWSLSVQDGAMKLYLGQLELNFKIIVDIFKVGIPAGIQGIVFAFSNLFIQSALNSFDSATIIAANTAAVNIEDFVYIGTYSFSAACMTFTSQNYGAKNYGVFKKLVNITMADTIIGGLSIGLLLLVFGRFFLGFYTNEQAVMSMGLIRFSHVTIFLFVNGMLDVYVASMRGFQYSTLPTVLMILGICGVRIFWLQVIFPMINTLECLYMCYPLSWFITLLVEYVLWKVIYNKKIKPLLA